MASHALVPDAAANKFSSSDDNVMMKQIQSTHSPDGRDIDMKHVLNVVEDILQPASPLFPGLPHTSQEKSETSGKKALHSGLSDLGALANTINKIACEISCKCAGGSDAHSTTVALLETLSSYSWDAEVVMALAAFSVNYSEFWLVAQLYQTSALAKSLALLKQLPDLVERADALRPKFEALNNLIKAMVDLTKFIVDIQELPSQYITSETQEMWTNHVPTAVYWIIRSILACVSQIMNPIGMGRKDISSNTDALELSSLAHKIRNIHSNLEKQLHLCRQHLAYQDLQQLFEMIHIDNIKILRALIYAVDDQLPLFNGSTKTRVGIDVLRRKNVLLFISDLDLSLEEAVILEQMYLESRQNPSRVDSQYEVVWLPVVDQSAPWTEANQSQFETIKGSMPWYSVYHPSLLEPAVIKYIKEVWHFNKKPLLVVLDPKGKVVNPNAIHMMWTWGSLAFPFSSHREEALWREESWRIELLVDGIVPQIFEWIVDGRYICLYGGEDMEWIRRFTTTASEVARTADIPLEMLYVGKSNPGERVLTNNTIIVNEDLGDVLSDLILIWFFWVRLESMLHSKKHLSTSVKNDPIMHEITSILDFDGSDQGWAVISRGSEEMTSARGDIILQSLTQFDEWKVRVGEVGFVPALIKNLQTLLTPHHSNRLILPRSGIKAVTDRLNTFNV